ncbi:MAG: LysM peptidoglycan-binding domain-containing protein [Eubacteriales bacterium]|nr:LysM peptidoglycan-binding domain-containing protein [Eubacteriales bacterium]
MNPYDPYYDPCMQRMYPQTQQWDIPGEVIETGAPVFACPPGYRTHSIAQGDTLSALAAAYQTTAAAIVMANPGLQADTILQIGRKLCIPPVRACAGQLYVLKSGDTLYELARVNGITVDAILAANPWLNPRLYRVGDTICLPVKKNVCPEGAQRYTVLEGDTWVSIAQLFDVSFAALRQANPGISLTGAPTPGTVLCVTPGSLSPVCPLGKEYQLEEGEGLTQAAAKWNVSEGALLAANPLFPPSYFIGGHKICIPKRMG